MNLNSFTKAYLWKLLIFFVAVVYLYIGWRANTDLTVGRFALFMDERITFDGVKNILHPEGIQNFLWSIFNGGDQRYGRSLWNSLGLISVVPESIWGDSGQILASRTLQSLLILASSLIFAFGLLRNWILRFVLVAAVLSIPYSAYYSTIPKPEALQVFFIALFCLFYIRRNLAFGWYWIFAGLAFGTKISTLPLLAIVFFGSLLSQRQSIRDLNFKKSLKTAVVYFASGLGIAVPILMLPISLMILGEILLDRLVCKGRLSTRAAMVVRFLGLIAIYFVSRKFLRLWVENTFLNTAHGADQASIHFYSWCSYFLYELFIAPPPLTILFLITMLVFGLAFIFILLQQAECNPKKIGALAIAIAGMVLNISIFIGVHRLWGMYLFSGTVVLLVGLMMMADQSLSSIYKNRFNLVLKFLGASLAIELLIISLVFWVPRQYIEYEKLSTRTQSIEFINQYASFKKTIEFINDYQIKAGKTIRVAYSPSLFEPVSNKDSVIEEFWGPYVNWVNVPDLLIFHIDNTPRGNPRPLDSPEHPNYLIEQGGYALHVADDGKTCSLSPCFERKIILPNGGEILQLKK
jgi:hypothetical protein